MRILFCCPCSVIRELGAGRHLIDLAEEMEKQGCACKIISPEDVKTSDDGRSPSYDFQLRSYLRRHAAQYDVIDYDHAHLPFARSDFPEGPLFVARSFLLRHHFLKIAIPRRRFFKSRARRYVYAWWLDPLRESLLVKKAQKTLMEADLVNVLNDDDRKELLASGIPGNKIVTIGLGLTRERFARFRESITAYSVPKTVVAVSTFDARKGAVEMPDLFRRILQAEPETRFRILGGRRSRADILRGFPPTMERSIEIVPEFAEADLPRLLSGGAVGLFPSYIEGFGLGVLEMLAAGVPVMAYRAPGPSTILPEKWLVPRGDYEALAGKVTALLGDEEALIEARSEALARVSAFEMASVARETIEAYAERLERARRRAS